MSATSPHPALEQLHINDRPVLAVLSQHNITVRTDELMVAMQARGFEFSIHSICLFPYSAECSIYFRPPGGVDRSFHHPSLRCCLAYALARCLVRTDTLAAAGTDDWDEARDFADAMEQTTYPTPSPPRPVISLEDVCF